MPEKSGGSKYTPPKQVYIADLGLLPSASGKNDCGIVNCSLLSIYVSTRDILTRVINGVCSVYSNKQCLSLSIFIIDPTRVHSFVSRRELYPTTSV